MGIFTSTRGLPSGGMAGQVLIAGASEAEWGSIDGRPLMLPPRSNAGMAVFSDDFTRSNSALGGVANGWVDTSSQWQITGNRLRPATGGYTVDFLSRPTSESLTDVSVTAVVEYADNGAGDGNSVLLWVRSDATTKNGYVTWLGTNTGTGPVLTLGKMAGGAPTFTSVSVPALTIGQYYRLTLQAVGSRVSAIVEAAAAPGVIIGRHSMTDAAYSSGGVMLSPLSIGGRASSVTIHDFRAAPRLICDGNSLTSAYQVPVGEDYPSRLGALLGSGWVVYNFGVPAQTTVAMLADATTQVDPLYDARRRSMLVAWEMTNHLFFGATPATALAAFKNYCAGRREAGFGVIAVTVLPRTEVATPPGFEAARLAVNAELLRPANLGVFWDAVYHVAGDERMQNTKDTTYYSDLTHLTATGLAVVAAGLATVREGEISWG